MHLLSRKVLKEIKQGAINKRWRMTNRSIVNKHESAFFIDNAVTWMKVTMECSNAEQVSTMNAKSSKQSMSTQVIYFRCLPQAIFHQ